LNHGIGGGVPAASSLSSSSTSSDRGGVEEEEEDIVVVEQHISERGNCFERTTNNTRTQDKRDQRVAQLAISFFFFLLVFNLILIVDLNAVRLNV